MVTAQNEAIQPVEPLLALCKSTSASPTPPTENLLGHISHPLAISHFYGATKYAVTALTDGIRYELRDQKSHIRVTSISPGFVKTEFAYRMLENVSISAEQLYSQIKVLEAEDISSAVVYALGAPPHVNVGEIIIRPVEQAM